MNDRAHAPKAGPEPCRHRLYSDARGSLVPVEMLDVVPFTVARVFWIFDVPKDEIRGGHAHRLCSQYLLCIRGAIEVDVDDGRTEKNWNLEAGFGLLVPAGVWAAERYVTAGSVLLVLCSHAYDVNDYIDDRDEFRRLHAAGTF